MVFLSGEDSMAVRLHDLGFSPGETVSCVLKGREGTMSAYLVRCAVIALREQNALEVFVAREPVEPAL